jgi:hypothetical protein
MTREQKREFDRKVTMLNRQMQCGRFLCRHAVRYAPDDIKMQIAYLRASNNVISSEGIETFDDMVMHFYAN